MKKTKEIGVWVDNMYIEGGEIIYGNYHRILTQPNKELLQAKLIIEIPEKKVEITESMLDEIQQQFFKDVSVTGSYADYIKDRLFK